MNQRYIAKIKKNDLVIEKAVKFLLQSDNIRTFLWGTTTKDSVKG